MLYHTIGTGVHSGSEAMVYSDGAPVCIECALVVTAFVAPNNEGWAISADNLSAKLFGHVM